MSTRTTGVNPLDLVEAPLLRDPKALPLQQQLHHRLRAAILEGRLPAGCRLPGSRALAETLEVSRNTVSAAYDQLAAEGFIRSDRRGTVVSSIPSPKPVPQSNAAPRVAARLAEMRSGLVLYDEGDTLRPGVPALTEFPVHAWQRAMNKAIHDLPPSALGYGDPRGEPALRSAIAQYFALSRGVHCRPEQVIITEGAQEALTLCVRLLAEPGDTAWVEDPGYRGARSALFGGDLRVVPKRVDAGGLRVSEEEWAAERPRIVYTTPSHQYPTGAVLTVGRRLALMAAATKYGAWIIEDDYDSEFRHAGAPIPAMQGLVQDAPVLYVGTFSKTMFPALRLGFLVLPDRLLQQVQTPLIDLLRGGHRLEQLALNEFMGSGQFARHLGRMRRLYRTRQESLREALETHLRIPHVIEGGVSGMHLTVRLPAEFPDYALVRRAGWHGLAPQALSSFLLAPSPDDNGLVIGYGNTATHRFEPLVRTLAGLVKR
jgi:GntR family transcriptional regulator/MocR family aminotransferase